MQAGEAMRPLHVDRGGQVLAAWRAGRTRRWHANAELEGSGDHTDGHSGRMAVLAICLFPDASAALYAAIAAHDLGEQGLGDVTADAKRADPVLKARLDFAEERSRQGMGLALPPLSADDARRLKFLDRLDAFLWMRLRAPWLEGHADWGRDRDWLRVSGAELGLGRACGGLL